MLPAELRHMIWRFATEDTLRVFVDADSNITANSPLFSLCRLARQDMFLLARSRPDLLLWSFSSASSLEAFCSCASSRRRVISSTPDSLKIVPHLTRVTIRVFKGFSSGWPADPNSKLLQNSRVKRNLVIKRHLSGWLQALVFAVPRLPCLTRLFFDLRWEEGVEDVIIQRFIRNRKSSGLCASQANGVILGIEAYRSEEQRRALAAFACWLASVSRPSLTRDHRVSDCYPVVE